MHKQSVVAVVGVALISRAGLLLAALLTVGLAVNGDSRHWVISGPGVLGQMGGGPFQLAVYVGGLLTSLTLLGAGAATLRHALRLSSRPQRADKTSSIGR